MAKNSLGKAPSPPSEELNGLAKKNSRLSNGKATVPTRRHAYTPRPSSWRSRFFNTIARIFTWYAIVTVLFRCPSTIQECDEASPAICTAYFKTKAAVVSPYVQVISNNVIAPTYAVIERYGAPRAQQAKEFLAGHWATTGQPHVDRARKLANEQYERSLAPHVEQASQVLSPYYAIARTSAERTYEELLLQATSSPDTKSSSFVVKPSESSSRKASSSAPPAETTSSSIPPTAESSASVVPDDSNSESQPVANNEVEIKAKNAKPDTEELRRIASETVAEDLHQWQTKFANAADEGAVEIEDKVEQLSFNMIESHVKGQGRKLVAELKEAAAEETAKLHKNIISLVQSSSRATRDETEDSAIASVRQAGLVIKEKAQNIRSWREGFEAQLHVAVTAAAQEHFDILGNMRDLALQKIGMKWAWMEGVTYKDWAKYHDMKKRFDEWTEELQQLIVTHPGLESAMNAAADVEDDGMEEAQAAARELARLKQVALWKIEAGDTSDNFDSEAMKAAAEAALAGADAETAEAAKLSPEQEGTAPEDAPEPEPEPEVEEEPEAPVEIVADANTAKVSGEAEEPQPAEEDVVPEEPVAVVEQPTEDDASSTGNSGAPVVAEAQVVDEPEIVADNIQESDAPEPVAEPAEAAPVAEVEEDVKQAPVDQVIEEKVVEQKEEEEAVASDIPSVAEEDIPSIQVAASDVAEASEAILEEIVDPSTDGGEGILSQASAAIESAGSKLSEAVVSAYSGEDVATEEAPIAQESPEAAIPVQVEEEPSTLLWSEKNDEL
ncbi:unnamed protein product [Parascedosporium putredinis]|uniref:Transcription factor hoxa13 n=1 Tax=Parascedosporium putredinis TaxID=1442378 RepID=A0A9P1H7S7_9PEZI|nr:unnamed protein product [Parascedosporium putredinis]CAI8000148.1 unnamed protein product [Parascedosporium putredinis]